MVDPAVKEQILHDLEQLTPEQQRRAAGYVRSLLERPTELPPSLLGREILERVGRLDAASAQQMREVIEEEFEQIDPDEW